MKFSDYTTKNVEEVIKEFKTSETGLSENEAVNRLKTYGFNEIKTKEPGILDILLRQFKSSFIYLLLIASFIAFLVGERINGFLILFFVFINVFLGFFQENRAKNAILLLKKYIPSNVRVLRNGKEEIIDKKFLVPGDIVLLEAGDIIPADLRVLKVQNFLVEAGDIIPADLRVLKVQNFLVDESILSGESVPVGKISEEIKPGAGVKSVVEPISDIFQAQNILFTGTSIISGEVEGLVIGTGKDTVFGQISKLVSGEIKESIYEKNLLKFSQIILRIVAITIIFVF